jgi:hypothetical protein
MIQDLEHPPAPAALPGGLTPTNRQTRFELVELLSECLDLLHRGRLAYHSRATAPAARGAGQAMVPRLDGPATEI